MERAIDFLRKKMKKMQSIDSIVHCKRPCAELPQHVEFESNVEGTNSNIDTQSESVSENYLSSGEVCTMSTSNNKVYCSILIFCQFTLKRYLTIYKGHMKVPKCLLKLLSLIKLQLLKPC